MQLWNFQDCFFVESVVHSRELVACRMARSPQTAEIIRFDRKIYRIAVTGCNGEPEHVNLVRARGPNNLLLDIFLHLRSETWTQWTIKAVRVKVHHRPYSLIMVRWCIRLTRFTLICEVIRYRSGQVQQNLKKRLFGLAACNRLSLSLPLSLSSSSYFLSFSKQKSVRNGFVCLFVCLFAVRLTIRLSATLSTPTASSWTILGKTDHPRRWRVACARIWSNITWRSVEKSGTKSRPVFRKRKLTWTIRSNSVRWLACPVSTLAGGVWSLNDLVLWALRLVLFIELHIIRS